MGATTYAANLQNVGLALPETEALLRCYAEIGDWKAVRARALEQNILGKRSTITVRHILKVVARRYVKAAPWLPSARLAGLFLARPVPQRAKAQVAFLYTVAEDLLVATCLRALVYPNGRPRDQLHANDVVQELRDLEAEHPELSRWQPYLRRRWASGFLTLLRDVGLMEAAPSLRLRPVLLLPEAFAIVFAWLVTYTESAKCALGHEVLRLWGMDSDHSKRLLQQGHERGWWRFASTGSMIDFKMTTDSMERLLDELV